MSDRGVPPDASPACPFIAFEDDRDGRSTRPDHRHRCFAELRPAPRATAHQEAFCLSAGFATCPTFVDWARREAARVRPPAEPAAPEAQPMAPPAPAASGQEAGDLVEPAGHDRDRRDWAAPPPWAAGAAAAAADSDLLAAPGSAPERPEPEPVPAADHETAPEIEPTAPTEPAAGVEAPSFLASRASESRPTSAPPPGAEPPRSTAPAPLRPAYPSTDLDDELEAGQGDDEDWAEPSTDEPQMRRFGPAAGRSRYDDTHVGREPSRRRPPADAGAPSWEKPRRFEAYPTIRTRTGMSRISPLLAAAVTILLLAAALFFIPPLLLGLGGDGSATPTPSASGATASATAEASPSPSPAPTPFVYTVKSGDTLSAIAKQFDVSIDDIIAANPTLQDPDKLGIGDKLIIPIGGLPSPSPSPAPASEEPSPSP